MTDEDNKKMGVDDFIASLPTDKETVLRELASRVFTDPPEFNPEPDEDEEIELTLLVKPDPMSMPAFYGPLGKFILAVDPLTEATREAMLLDLMALIGCYCPNAYQLVGADEHSGILFVVIMGKSKIGRKGMAESMARRFMEYHDAAWAKSRIDGGLSTREGIIVKVQDALWEEVPNDYGEYEWQEVRHGVEDKRVCFIHPEVKTIFDNKNKAGNSLGEAMMEIFDMVPLHNSSKGGQATATNYSISIIASGVPSTIRNIVSQSDAENGQANRMLWIFSESNIDIPRPKKIELETMPEAIALSKAILLARQISTPMEMNEDAGELWDKMYTKLKHQTVPGIAGEILSRAEALVLRLTGIYAMLDAKPGPDNKVRATITQEHIRAALALWDYAIESVKYIWGDSLGNKMADKILNFIKDAGAGGLTRTQLNKNLNGKVVQKDIEKALTIIANDNQAAKRMEDKGDIKDTEIWTYHTFLNS